MKKYRGSDNELSPVFFILKIYYSNIVIPRMPDGINCQEVLCFYFH